MEILVTSLEAHRAILIHPQAYERLALAEAFADLPAGANLADAFPNGLVAVFRGDVPVSVVPNEHCVLPLPSPDCDMWQLQSQPLRLGVE